MSGFSLDPSTFGFFLRAGPQCVLARSTRSRGRHCAAYNRRRRRARPASQGWALLQLPYAPVVQIAPATRSSIPQNRLVQPKPHTNNKRASPPTRLSCARLADDHTTDGEQPSTPSLDRPLLDVRARARAHAVPPGAAAPGAAARAKDGRPCRAPASRGRRPCRRGSCRRCP